jgi:hypothetical protein
MAMKRKVKIEESPRERFLNQETLERIASLPAGGSGESAYITGRIQCMAQEILDYRKRYGNNDYPTT